MKKILVVVGPTAVGKSDLAIKLAQKFNGEIISGDSMQVYRNLDIGTAKVLSSEREGIKHYLIDVRDVNQQYGVSEFVKDAKTLINSITATGCLPIIVGGTGYYVQALINGLNLGGENSSNEKIKTDLEKKLAKVGKVNLWNELNLVDNKSAEKIPPENSRRVIRALEVYKTTGKKFSEQKDGNLQYDALLIGLNCDRKLLYKRINLRVDEMVRNGLIDENHWLYTHGGIENPASKAIGYREFVEYFSGEHDLNQTIEQIKLDSRHYAKRQLTWFRNKMKVNWFNLVEHPEEINNINKLVQDWRKNEFTRNEC